MDCTPENTPTTNTEVKKWPEPPCKRQDKPCVSILVKWTYEVVGQPTHFVETLFRGIEQSKLPRYLTQVGCQRDFPDAETVTFLKSLVRPIQGHEKNAIGVTDQADARNGLWSVRGVDITLLIVRLPKGVELY